MAPRERVGTGPAGGGSGTSSLGGGNSIFLSMRPGRSRAESRMSILLVAMITCTGDNCHHPGHHGAGRTPGRAGPPTLMFLVASKPSSWLRSSSIVRCTSLSPPEPPSRRDEPMESISSMKMMEGACSRAITNSSRTIRAPGGHRAQPGPEPTQPQGLPEPAPAPLPSPMNFCTSSEPDTRMKVQSV